MGNEYAGAPRGELEIFFIQRCLRSFGSGDCAELIWDPLSPILKAGLQEISMVIFLKIFQALYSKISQVLCFTLFKAPSQVIFQVIFKAPYIYSQQVQLCYQEPS